MVSKYRPSRGRELDSEKCAASVISAERWADYHQCSRKRQPGREWCRQHDPDPPLKKGQEKVTVYRVDARWSRNGEPEVFEAEGVKTASQVKFKDSGKTTDFRLTLKLTEMTRKGCAFTRAEALQLFIKSHNGQAHSAEVRAKRHREHVAAAQAMLEETTDAE